METKEKRERERRIFFKIIFVEKKKTKTPVKVSLVKISDWNLFRTNPIYSEIHPTQSEKSFKSCLMQIGKKSIRLNLS